MNPICHSASLRRSGFFAAAVAFAFLAAPSAHAQNTLTWNGSTSITWTTATNWDGGVAPSNSLTGNITRFNQASYSFAPTLTNNTSIAGFLFDAGNTGSLTLLTGGVANRANIGASGIMMNSGSGAVIIGGGTSQGLDLGADQVWTNNSGSLLNVRTISNMSNSTAYTLTLNGSGSGGILIGVGGIINGGSVGTISIVNSYGGGVTTINGPNTFTGGVKQNSGTLSLGSNGALGTGALTINGGTIDVTAARTTTNNNAQNWNGNFTFNGTNTWDTGTGAVTMNASRTVTVTSSSMTVGGVIGDTGGGYSLTKAGGGSLILAGANTHSGGIILNTGSLLLGNDAALGTGTLTVNDGTTIDVTAARTTTNNNAQSWNGNFTFNGTSTWDTGTGAVTMNASRTVTVTASTMTVGGAIGDSGSTYSLTKEGAGTLTLGGANTYNGTTTVSAGVLRITNSSSLGTVTNNTTVISGAALQLANNITVGGEELTIAGTGISTTGAILNISGDNSLGGNITLTGTSSIASDAGTLTLNGATLQRGPANNYSLTLTGAGNIAVNSVIGNIGTGTVTKAGAGALTLNATNTFARNLLLNAGTLNINNAQALGATSTSYGLTIAAGTTIDNTSGAAITTVAKLLTMNGSFTFTGTNDLNLGTGAATLGTATGTSRTITTTAGALTIGGAIADGTTANTLIKAGAGTLVLNGANTYTGGTVLSAGTLSLGNTAALGAGNLTIDGGGVVLAAATTTISGVVVNNTGTTTLNTDGVGNRAITLGTAGLAINSGAGVVTFGTTTTLERVSFTLSGSQTWTNDSSNELALVVNNTISTAGFTLTIAGTGDIVAGGAIGTAPTGGGIIKNGTGNFTIGVGNANLHTYGVVLNTGKLILGNNNSLGTANSTLTINGGTVDVTGARTTTNNNAQNWNGNFTFGGTNTWNTGTGAVTMNASRTVTVDASTMTVGGAIGDSGGGYSLTKAGAGRLVLAGDNTHSGGIILNDGTLRLGNNAALGTGVLTINGGTIDVTAERTTTNNNAQNWNGNFTFNGTNTWDTGTGAVTMNASRTVTVSGSTMTVGGAISGVGFGLTKAGAGTLTLNGTNTYDGGTTVNAGTLKADIAAALPGYASGTIAVNNAGSVLALSANATNGQWTSAQIDSLLANTNLTFGVGTSLGIDNIENFTYNTNITNANMGLVKSGGGRLYLGGDNTYSGNTVVIGGTILATHDNAYGTGTVTFNGGSWGGEGNHTIANNIIYAVNTNSNNLGGTNVTHFAGQTSGTGNLTVNGFENGIVRFSGNNSEWTGNWKFNGAITLQLNHIDAMGSGTTITFNTNAAANAARGILESQVALTGANAITQDIDLGGTLAFTGNSTIRTTAAMEVTGDITGGVNATFVKDGADTLTLSGTNTYLGSTSVNAGTISFTSGNASATGTQSLGTNASVNLGVASVSSGTLNYIGSGAATLAKDINASGNGTIQNSGSGLLTLSGAIAKNGTVLTIKGGGSGIDVTGSIGGASANSDLIIDGGLTTLSTANTYNGPTFIINGANLTANVTDALPTASGNRTAVSMDQTGSGSSTVTLGASQSIASLTGNTTSTVNLNANNLTVGTTADSTTFAGVISGAGSLVKDGASTQILSGVNTYTGSTTVNNGTLRYGVASAINTSSNVTVNANGVGLTATFDLNGYSGTIGTLTLGGTGATGTSSHQVTTGAGTLTLGGNVTYDSTGDSSTSAGISGNLDLGAASRTFNVANSAGTEIDLTISAIVSGTAVGLTKDGAGRLLLGAANTYEGTTTVTAGALRITNNNALGTTGNNTEVSAFAALELDGSGGDLTISESLVLNGSGIYVGGALRNIAGNNSYNGAITYNATTTRINSDFGTLTINGDISGSAGNLDFQFGGAGDITVNGTISNMGTGSLTKDASGTLSLLGANTFENGTTISGGRLVINTIQNAVSGTANSLGVGNSEALTRITMAGGTTLKYVGSASGSSDRTIILSSASGGSYTLDASGTTTFALSGCLTNSGTSGSTNLVLDGNGNGTHSAAFTNGTGSNTGAITKNGTGTWTLSGASSYDGTTTVNAGMLVAAHDTALGSTTNGTSVAVGGTLALTGNISVGAEALTLTADASASNSILTSIGGNNTWGGDITVNTGSGLGRTILNSEAGSNLIVAGNINLSGTNDFVLRGNGTGEISGQITGSQRLFKSSVGNGTWTLSGDNSATFTGKTAIGNGVLQISSEANLGTTPGSFVSNQLAVGGALTNGTLKTTANMTISANRGVALNAGGGTFETDASTNLTVNSVISSTGSLTKEGAGNLILAGNNTYSGPTNVNEGTLLVNGNQSSANGTVTVASGATLGGNGTLGGATTINGILAPGNGDGNTDTLNIVGNVTWVGASSNSTSTNWIFDLGASDNDLLNITGNFIKQGPGTTFHFDFANSANVGMFTLVHWSGSNDGFTFGDFTSSNLGGGLTGSFSMDDNNLYFSAVPEPSTWVAMAAMALGAVVIFLRRRKATGTEKRLTAD